jgi:hypothetical protein
VFKPGKLDSSFPGGMVYCFTDKEKMRMWLLNLRKDSTKRRKDAIDEILKMIPFSSSTGSGGTGPKPGDDDVLTGKPKRTNVGCSEVFNNHVTNFYNYVAKDIRLQYKAPQCIPDSQRPSSPTRPPHDELFIPDNPGSIINLTAIIRSPPPNQTFWSSVIRGVYVYGGCLMLNDTQPPTGVWLCLWGPPIDDGSSHTDYPDLSWIGYDNKAKSAQQV